MASLRRTALTAALVWAALGAPAAAFEVVKEGGPAARVMFLGLGSTERACGSFNLATGAQTIPYDPSAFGCSGYEQFVVIVRAPFGKGMAFIGELCTAIMAEGSRLTLTPTGATQPGAREFSCALESPPE